MSDQSRTDPSKRLEETLGRYSLTEMKAVREEVGGEIKSLGVSQSREGRSLPPPSIPREIPINVNPGPSPSNIEDLQRAGKIAEDFMQGMDRIADVLMLLVMKFGRASTLTRAVFVGNFIVVLLLIANIVALVHINDGQTAIQQDAAQIQRPHGKSRETG